MPCPKIVVEVKGEKKELEPIKVWVLQPRGRKGVKIGLFKDPDTGKYFRAKMPEDYPAPCP